MDFFTSTQFLMIVSAAIGILMILFIGFTLLKIFLGNPLLVGCSRFFLENSDRKARFGLIGTVSEKVVYSAVESTAADTGTCKVLFLFNDSVYTGGKSFDFKEKSF